MKSLKSKCVVQAACEELVRQPYDARITEVTDTMPLKSLGNQAIGSASTTSTPLTPIPTTPDPENGAPPSPGITSLPREDEQDVEENILVFPGVSFPFCMMPS